jgi:hypothetical protein
MFLHQPWMLIGLGLCAVPVLIHLLSRRVYRREPWAAMRFLRAALDRRARQLRLESWLLLVVRTLLVLAIVLAAAEPLFYASDAAQVRPPWQRILVVDLSASLGARSAGERRLDRLRQEVEAVLRGAGPGDSFQLVRIAALPPRTLIRRSTYDPEEIRAELRRWDLTEESADVVAGLQAVRDLVRTPHEEVAREVIVFSDLQRSNWWPDEAGARAPIQRLLSELTQRAGLRFVNVAGEAAGNVGIVSLRSSHELAAPEQPLEFTAVVRNYGFARTTLRVDWFVNGKLVDSSQTEVGGADEAAVRFVGRAPPGHAVHVEARLVMDDALAADNRRFLAIPVRDLLRVLIVDGRPSLDSIDGAGGYLAVALAPIMTSAGTGLRRIPIQTELLPAAALPDADLSRFDCIWLCDPVKLAEGQRRRLAQYASSGGGLILAVGDQTQASAWNEWTDAAGRRVLPAKLSSSAEFAATTGAPANFRLAPASHPITADFEGNPQAGLRTTQVHRYYTVEDSAEDAREVLAFSTGEPAILEHPLGAGRVALVLTSVDDRWSNWAVWPSYLPLVHRLTMFAAAGAEHQRRLEVGNEISRLWPASQPPPEALLTVPSGQRISLTPTCTAEHCLVQHAATESGIYQLEGGDSDRNRDSIAVNVAIIESLPAGLDEAMLTREVLPGHKFAYGPSQAGPASRSSAQSTRGSLAGVLLLTSLALLVVESLLAWRSRLGVLALVGVGLAVVLRQSWLISHWLAAALAIGVATAVVYAGKLRLRKAD